MIGKNEDIIKSLKINKGERIKYKKSPTTLLVEKMSTYVALIY